MSGKAVTSSSAADGSGSSNGRARGDIRDRSSSENDNDTIAHDSSKQSGAQKHILRSWTPSTTHLLLGPSPPSRSSPSSARPPCPYFDILDHVLGPSVPAQIQQEIQWLQDQEGWMVPLQTARVAMEVQSDNLLALLGAFGVAAADADGGSGEGASTNSNDQSGATSVRGDVSSFVPRAVHRPSQENNQQHRQFVRHCPGLHRLISSVESTAIQKLVEDQSANVNVESDALSEDMSKQTNGNNQNQKRKRRVHVQIDSSLTSVQIARYPGDGTSGYPRHCDRGRQCASEPVTIQYLPKQQDVSNGGNGKRILTAVYYLTPSDWDDELDGGVLRVYPPGPASPHSSDMASSSSLPAYYDVTPYSDRLVIFRSDLVEHEVMPSLRRERMAVTVWLYGDITMVEETESDNAILSAQNSREVDVSTFSRKQSNLMRNPPPPLPISASSDASTPRIFVSIPAYRDPETYPTIQSLFETATHPDRIFVGVVWQVDTSSQNVDAACFEPDLPQPWSSSHVRELRLDYRHATGPCPARAMAQMLHRDEEYILQIDSHMRFRSNWDVYLLDQIQKYPDPNKSILTAYPPAYVLDANGEAECVNNETRGTILVPWKFSEGMLRQKGRLLRSDSAGSTGVSGNDNVPCPLYAAGFNFSSAAAIRDCPYDATLHHLFFGEEMSMAVRLFTNGYDFYAPPQSVCYHKWTRDHRPTIQGDTNGTKENRDSKVSVARELRNESLEVVKRQLRGVGPGLGTFRPASDFASRVGVNFETMIIEEGAENGGLPADAFAPSFDLNNTTDAAVEGDEPTTTSENNGDIVSLVSAFLSAAGSP